MNVSIKIIITKEYKLVIKIDSKFEEEINPCISFNGNFVSIGKENENSIHFMKEWIENPEDFTLYSIQYQGKEYQLIAEVLFALLINEFKQKIEREYIIENTILEIPIESKKAIQRIKTSLESIGLVNIIINEFDFDYSEQGEYLNEILEKKETIEKQKRMIERAKDINPTMKEKLNQIDLNQENILEEDQFELEIIKRMTIKERTEMKLCKLDNYCIFIASRYFESLDDHINLVRVSKRMRGNMEKFHYNPISLNEETLEFFPNIETLHIFNKGDEYLSGGRIKRYVNWRRISYNEFEEEKSMNERKEIEYKRIVWTKEDTYKEYNKQKRNDFMDFDLKITISERVTELDEDCFDNSLFHCWLKELIIPVTVKTISNKLIENCTKLTNITLPLNESQMIIGNKIFKNQSHLKQDIYLPNSIKIINGNEVNGSRFEIPTTVTSFDEECFYKCYELDQLIIPETVIYIPKNTFMKLPYLKKITMKSNKYELTGNRIFFVENDCLYSIELRKNVKKINNEDVKPLETLTIATNVTKLSDNCFANCSELTEIKGLENIKEIGKGCFINCPKLNTEQYPEVQKNVDEYLKEVLKEEHQKQLEEWTSLKCSEILFDSNIDNWSQYTSVLNERIIGKKQLVFLIEDEDGELFGYYFNTQVENYFQGSIRVNKNSFHFNLQSKNNRLSKPMKFEIKDLVDGGYHLYYNSSDLGYLIFLGNIGLMKENYKNESKCYQYKDTFDYHGIENALCGKSYRRWEGEHFTQKRILVIQMKQT